jgi:hypothetical protein
MNEEHYKQLVDLCLTHNELESCKSLTFRRIKDSKYDSLKEDLDKIIEQLKNDFNELYIKTDSDTQYTLFRCGFSLRKWDTDKLDQEADKWKEDFERFKKEQEDPTIHV